ncbi:MAG: hypothetical protein Q4C70_10405 [Planctomycetia bacterium]|nr:hypothetical protein [Planctomycetia bacterium]
MKNGSFETWTNRQQYGYIYKNGTAHGTVADWTYTPTNYVDGESYTSLTRDYGYGVSLASEEFGKNCGPLDGDYTLFIQRPGTVSQTVTGLTPGEFYTYSFKYDARTSGGHNTNITANLGDYNLLKDQGFNSRNPFYDYKITFRATSETMDISFANTHMGNYFDGGQNQHVINDNSLLIDAVSMTKAENTWWYSDASTLWTSDATSGVVADGNYTHALNFNAGTTNLNGIQFNGVTNTKENNDRYAINAGYAYGADGTLQDIFTNENPGSQALANGFMYNFSDVTLKDLLPGVEYTTTFYMAAWNDTTDFNRSAIITAPNGEKLIFNENDFRDADGRKGGLLTWTGTASEDGTLQFKINSLTQDTLHIYGVSNMLVAGQTPESVETNLLLDTKFGGTNGNANNGKTIHGTVADVCNFISPTDKMTWSVRGRSDNISNFAKIENGALKTGANTASMMEIDSTQIAGEWIDISVDMKIGTLFSTFSESDRDCARGLGIGFTKEGTGSNQESGIGFTGLVLRPDGALEFYDNVFGTDISHAKHSDAVAWSSEDGSAFSKDDWHTLNLTLAVAGDGESAKLVGLDISGSAADYSKLLGSNFATTDLFTILSSSANSWDYFGYVDNLSISTYVPEPSTWVLCLTGLTLLAGVGYRKKGKK